MSLLRPWSKRRVREEDFDEEISSHLQMAARDKVDRSDSKEEAQYSARREFGNAGLIKEVTREIWGWTSFERLGQDLRYAARLLGKSPGFTAIAVLSIALGIGANTAIFSLIDAVLLKALPVRNSNELVAIGDTTRVGSVSEGSGRTDLFSYPFYERFRERNRVFSDVYASGRSEYLEILPAGGRPSSEVQGGKLRGRFVTGNYFSVLGVPALIGRTFDEQEVHVEGGAPVVVISYACWNRRFARNPAVVGQRISVNGSIFTIIGVMPPEFFGDIVGVPMDVWFPITMQAQANPGHNYLKDTRVSWLMLMGRLKPGVSQARAAAAVRDLAPQIFTELYSSSMGGEDLRRLRQETIQVSSGAKGFSRLRHELSLPLIALMGIVLLVLLICCANVANLQLARATSRSREMSLRLAVGAGQARLVRQLLTESLALSFLGGGAGLLFAQWGSHLLLGFISRSDQTPVDVHLDAAVLLFTAAVSIIAGLLFGLAPALQTTCSDLVSSLKDSKSGQSHGFAQSFGKALIVSQIVFSLTLLVGAGLFIRTLRNLENMDVGYTREGLLLAEVDFKTAGYKDNQVNQLARQVIERLQNLPGVRSATVSENGLFSGTDSETDAEVEGYAYRSKEDKLNGYDRVGPNYFETVGTPVILGRGIGPQDTETAPKVAVINEKMARFYFRQVNPLGRHIFEGDGKDRTAVSIVGVVRDAKQRDLREPVPRRFYKAYLQHRDEIETMNFEIRTRIESSALSNSVRGAIKNVDPKLPITSLKPAAVLIDETLDQEKLVAKLSSFFGLLALVLAAIGLYGVMSYLTVRRTAEIGIRMALGAERSGILGMVMADTLRLLMLGLVVGILAACSLGKLFSKALFGLSAFDPLTIVSAALVIVVAGVTAAFLPAWRASRIEPTLALRHE
ncbi:MAG: ABC transporter permease [Acidobacteriaceae bacterium]|nr:ABC transporter permease [Acidobacteriaceae bacterium]MBV9778943.1 ABC transporter permease [Acidobacteriaceae bacterium]